MKVTITIYILLVLMLNIAVSAQVSKDVASLDPGFKNRAFNHVQRLAELGVRAAGSEIEAKAILYIKKQFVDAGCTVEIEPFEFDCFVLEKAVAQIGEEKFEPEILGFNPYDDTRKLTGEVAFYDPATPREEFRTLELEGKVVVTAKPANFYQLAFKKPGAIVFVDSAKFVDLKKQDIRTIDIDISGEVQTIKSANVVASIEPKSEATKEIIISAHLDSYNGPGADDNASGVGVMIELARYFGRFKEQLPCRLRFVAFGAEELNWMGSQAYLETHQQELQNCELLFNMDSIGGSDQIYIEGRRGVRRIPEIKGLSQIPEQLILKAGHDFNDRWNLLHPAIMITFNSSNVPDWLKEFITTTVDDLGYEITLAGGMGSDHRIFVQAGIAATNMNISGNPNHHTPEDTPEQVNPGSLQKAGNIVAGVVIKTMDRF